MTSAPPALAASVEAKSRRKRRPADTHGGAKGHMEGKAPKTAGDTFRQRHNPVKGMVLGEETGSARRQSQQTRQMALGNSLSLSGAKAGKKDADADYVFELAVNGDGSLLAASLSTCEVKLVDVTGGATMAIIGTLGPLQGQVSGLVWAKEAEGRGHLTTLMSSSADGCVRTWDTRTCKESALFSSEEPDEFWSLACGGSSGFLLAAGGNSKITLWDRRRPEQQLACFEEAHTEAVTQLKFHPLNPSNLFSASVDGLICSFDTNAELSDDEALQSVLQVDTSIARIGFYGKLASKLWCLTNIETLSLWDLDQSERLGEVPNTRERASKRVAKWSSRAENGTATATAEGGSSQVDYLIECHGAPEEANDSLWLMAGSNSGAVWSLPVRLPDKVPDEVDDASDILPPSTSPSSTSITSTAKLGLPRLALVGGHSDVVRTIRPTPTSRSGGMDGWGDLGGEGVVCWSGGEDGKICSWVGSGLSSGAVGRGNGKSGRKGGEGPLVEVTRKRLKRELII
eukprot:TRINITY_DN30062_c0_g1_i1.p1 TRINITY_DN30062_c0_g1~~TRINITY_DN30062_c0_g1_i1.p1  ORF type:complete len:514 (-),score=63.45 TRINITY_DN30062_c0_g1_i1:355-1896(-)